MLGRFLAGPVGSWLRVFVAFTLGAWLIDLRNGGGLAIMDHIGTYVVVGLVAVLPLVIAYLNPADTRFGVGRKGA